MEHTKEPWAYRPHEHDDWGIIRAPVTEQGQWLGGIICQARDPERTGESELAACRAARIDPWEANARRIVSCVNAMQGIPDPAAYVAAFDAMERELSNLRKRFDRRDWVLSGDDSKALHYADTALTAARIARGVA